MPARKKKEEQINLLPQKGFQSTTAGRILSWILSTFRVIVIVTEVIVMMAFLSRFYFDAQNSDLNEEIDHKRAVLAASQDFEFRFKDVQKRLTLFSSLTNSQTSYSEILNSVKKSVPLDVVVSNISGSKESFKIKAITPNSQSIQQFIVNLDFNLKESEVALANATSKTDQPGIVEFVLEIKESKQDKKT